MTDPTSSPSPLDPTQAASEPGETAKPAVSAEPPARAALRLALLFGILVTAQLLVFNHAVGLGLGLFFLGLFVLTTWRLGAGNAYVRGAASLAAIALVVEAAEPVSIALALVLLGLYALGRAGWPSHDDIRLGLTFADTYLLGPLRAPLGIARSLRDSGRGIGTQSRWRTAFRQWSLPLVLTAAFLALFVPANPWLALSLDFLNPLRWVAIPEPVTVGLWVAVGLAVWPLLALDRPADQPTEGGEAAARRFSQLYEITGGTTPGLSLFNAVFLLQTIADLLNLWPIVLGTGPASTLLPEGMTYAEFAKAGAYPLLVATVLAALIILTTLQRSDPPRITLVLVVAWIAQTLLLLASATVRLDLYVDAYGLTHLRFYTFVGIGLIGAGLVLVIWRLSRGKTNGWLIRQSLIAIAITAFGCGVTNVNGFIGARNIARAHYAEVIPPGAFAMWRVDAVHLCHLGSDALIPIATHLDELGAAGGPTTWLEGCMANLEGKLIERQSDWRSWSWRGARILDGLETLRKHDANADEAPHTSQDPATP